MVKNIAVALCAVALLSSCGGKKGMNSGADTALGAKFAKEAGSDRVFFKLNESHVSKEAHAALAKQAEWLKSHESVKATVEGHCDERGTREYNLALGAKRAHHTMKALEKHGVAKDRLDSMSYGKDKPPVSGTGEEVWKQNRTAITAVR